MLNQVKIIQVLSSMYEEEKMIDFLHNNKEGVNELLLHMMEYLLHEKKVYQFGSEAHFLLAQKLIYEQWVRNKVELFLVHPRKEAINYARSHAEKLLVDYSLLYLGQIFLYNENDKQKTGEYRYHTNVLFHIAVETLLKEKDKDKLNVMISRGLDWFTHEEVLNELYSISQAQEELRHKCFELLQMLHEFRPSFRLEYFKSAALRNLLIETSGSGDAEIEIKGLEKAVKISTGESELAVANIKYMLGLRLLARDQGSPVENRNRAEKLLNEVVVVFNRETYPHQWAAIQNGLGRCIVYRFNEKADENIEAAIGYFMRALEEYTIDKRPYDYALACNNLGATYLERIRGNKQENIEQAIAWFQKALYVQTPEYVPADWTLTVMNLGNAYNTRVDDDRVSAADKAIYYFNQALKIHSPNEQPQTWAELQTKIASAYCSKAAGIASDLSEKALEHLQQALEILDPQLHLKEWAEAQGVLSEVYSIRVKGEAIENLEKAIEASLNYIRVYDLRMAPYLWATTQINLANLYRRRIKGNPSANRKLAMVSLDNALTILKPTSFPFDYARAQHIYGIIYDTGPDESKEADQENAIYCYSEALRFRTPDKISSWLETVNGLGNVWLERKKGKPADNINTSLSYFEMGLKAVHRDRWPVLWAILHYNCGRVYQLKAEHGEAGALKTCIEFYKNALEVQRKEVNPAECFKIASKLGDIYSSQGAFREAKDKFILAHEAAELVRIESVREQTRGQIAAECHNLYGKLVKACLQLKETKTALYYAGVAKARLFSDTIGTVEFVSRDSGVEPPERITALQEIAGLRAAIDQLCNQEEYFYVDHEMEARREGSLIYQVRKKRGELAKKVNDLYYKFPQYTQLGYAEVPGSDLLMQLSTDLGNIPLLEYYRDSEGWKLFLVYKEMIVCRPLPLLTDERLTELVSTLMELELSLVSGVRPEQLNSEMAEFTKQLYQLTIEPVRDLLPENGNLVIAPAQLLHWLPIHIASDPVTQRYLADDFAISYIPSLPGLYQLYRLKGLNNPVKKNILNVVYSAIEEGQPLYQTLPAAKLFNDHFLPPPDSVYLFEAAATANEVLEACKGRNYHTVNFACHGQFSMDDPENSGLLLSKGFLTAERIRTELTLPGFPQVILTACQTGRTLVMGGDEAIGLVHSFFAAGAGSVISSLWSVPEKSTMELFTHYFRLASDKPPAEALQLSMKEVRARKCWEHPLYWAAFKFTGLPG